MDETWVDFSKELKRRLSRASWVPLHMSIENRSKSHLGLGSWGEYKGAHSLLVPLSDRDKGESYNWSSNMGANSYAGKDWYKPADIYQYNEKQDLGFHLILTQRVPGHDEDIWHLHPDLLIALKLVREGDVWKRPAEGWCDVIKLHRNYQGEPCLIEIRSEHLRDYLCARQAALRIATFRERHATIADVVGMQESNDEIDFEGGRISRVTVAVDSDGHPHGSGVAFFKVGRTDVDADDDVPIMGPYTDENTKSENYSFTRGGDRFWRISLDYWRDEWIEPGNYSPRVRYDKGNSSIDFITEADGTRQTATELCDEDIGRWLWFKPDVINALLDLRGTSLTFYTKDTGGLATPADSGIHFGINESGLINVYAYDIARLEEWHCRLWAGFNVTPEGKVCAELLASQVECEPAKTHAPEKFLGNEILRFRDISAQKFGKPLIRIHNDFDEILNRCHRFRALTEHGVLSLAKDCARLTADSFDKKALKAALISLGYDNTEFETLGSLKILEKILQHECGTVLGSRIMGPLFACYELRLSDAHLPKSDREEAEAILGISSDDRSHQKGHKLLHWLVSSLAAINVTMSDRERAQGDLRSE